MTSSHHAPYVLGYTRATLAGTKGCKPARVSESQKPVPVRIGGLETRLHEGGVASNRGISNAAVNMFPGLVHTARHTTKVGNTRSRWPNPQGREPSKVGSMIGVKS